MLENSEKSSRNRFTELTEAAAAVAGTVVVGTIG